jgi:N utilization substance protein B
MLNRQLLRIKAMKALYAFRQSQSSDFHLGIDMIEQDFEPDYLQETPPDEKQLALDAKKAIELYKKYYKEVQPVVEEPVEPKIRGAVMKAVKNYHQTVSKDKKHHFQLMLDEVEQIYDQYLAMLLLLQKLSELAKEELKLKVERVKVGNPVAPHHFKFSDNSFVKFLKNDRELMQQIEKEGSELTKILSEPLTDISKISPNTSRTAKQRKRILQPIRHFVKK